MARPVKHNADFFPHDAHASHGRTVSILFNNFQHEGVSSWWQLLETLSTTENHVITIRNPEDIEFLSSEMRIPTEKCKLILKKMAELDAIDRDLYSEGKIWSQNLVDRLRPVYENRKQDSPVKPELIGIITPFLLPLTELLPVVNTQSRESKVERVKNSKVEKPAPDKKPYGEFGNVFLTDEEYRKLELKFNSSLPAQIENLSRGIKSKGYKYTDFYSTLLRWAEKDAKEKNFRGEKKGAQDDDRPVEGLEIVR